MKVRTDYVSNSSSSSFVLVGKIFSIENFVKQLMLSKKLKIPADVLKDYENEDLTNDEVFDVFYDMLVDDFDIYTASCGDYDIDEVCIGLDPSRMKNNETLGEFKEKILKKLTEFGLKANKSEVKFVTGGSDAAGCSFFGDIG